MKSDWLAAANFERTHEVLTAISVLSIHAKLALAGVDDPAGDAEIQQARDHLLAFLDRIAAVVKDAESERGGAVVGTDPQMSELARRFLPSGAHGSSRSGTIELPLAALVNLVRSERPEDLQTLIRYLEALRKLIEEETHADMAGILGDE